MIGLCKAFANCHIAKSEGYLFLETTSYSIPVPVFILEVLYQSIYKPSKLDLSEIHHFKNF